MTVVHAVELSWVELCRYKRALTDTDLCPCGETQTMFHIVESCPLTKLNGGLSRLHSADEDAVLWLTSYGSWVMTRILEEEVTLSFQYRSKFLLEAKGYAEGRDCNPESRDPGRILQSRNPRIGSVEKLLIKCL